MGKWPKKQPSRSSNRSQRSAHSRVSSIGGKGRHKKKKKDRKHKKSKSRSPSKHYKEVTSLSRSSVRLKKSKKKHHKDNMRSSSDVHVLLSKHKKHKSKTKDRSSSELTVKHKKKKKDKSKKKDKDREKHQHRSKKSTRTNSLSEEYYYYDVDSPPSKRGQIKTLKIPGAHPDSDTDSDTTVGKDTRSISSDESEMYPMKVPGKVSFCKHQPCLYDPRLDNNASYHRYCRRQPYETKYDDSSNPFLNSPSMIAARVSDDPNAANQNPVDQPSAPHKQKKCCTVL